MTQHATGGPQPGHAGETAPPASLNNSQEPAASSITEKFGGLGRGKKRKTPHDETNPEERGGILYVDGVRTSM